MTESVDSKTSELVARENAEQALWRLRASGGKLDWFDALVDNEFVPPEQQRANANQRLRQLLTFASTHVPYYREVFAARGLSAGDIVSPGQLPQLPELSKQIIYQQGDRLRSRSLPSGQKHTGSHASSGSTGRPVRVHHTDYVWFMKMILTQRQLRWYRFDPMLKLGSIRSADNLLRPGGKLLELGETDTRDAWPGLGKYFFTGPYAGFNLDNPLEQVAEWLQQQQPGYLHSTSSMLEHLAFAFQERDTLAGLHGIRAISEPLTQGQRARIESTFKAPVCMSYGLNEIGWLATRCREGGRYHVHTEHCLIEIVDDQGQPRRVGEYGRVLVTTLSNAAMPLIRYDTDDLAQVVGGPCPCGRTLPAIGDIIGRYSLLHGLPAHTTTIVASLRAAMDTLPPNLCHSLREYQIRQSLDGNFQLCLVLAGPRHAGFDDYFKAAFSSALIDAGVEKTHKTSMTIMEVSQIPRTPSKKFFHFDSEFTRPGLAKDRVGYPGIKS